MITNTVTKISKTDPMRREANRGLMVRWINADLINRAGHDVRSSFVIYDEDRLFIHAFPSCFEPTDEAWRILFEVGARYWSRGIV